MADPIVRVSERCVNSLYWFMDLETIGADCMGAYCFAPFPYATSLQFAGGGWLNLCRPVHRTSRIMESLSSDRTTS
jgi:hypothetical protein